MNSLESIAIIFATLMGPIFAILITFWRENRKAKMSARYHIFRTLMSTRRIALTREHVDALNLIETEFYGHAKVQAAFRDYIAHLSSQGVDEASWHDIRNNKLATLLHQLSLSVGMPIGEIDIRTGGYSPKGWESKDVAEQFVLGLARGIKTLPVEITNLPVQTLPEPSTVETSTILEAPGMRPPGSTR